MASRKPEDRGCSICGRSVGVKFNYTKRTLAGGREVSYRNSECNKCRYSTYGKRYNTGKPNGRPRLKLDRPCSHCGGYEGLNFGYKRDRLSDGTERKYRNSMCNGCANDVGRKRKAQKRGINNAGEIGSDGKPLRNAEGEIILDAHGILKAAKKVEESVKRKIKAVEKAPLPGPCNRGQAHIWLIDPPDGAVSNAHCPACNQTRQFINTDVFTNWGQMDKRNKEAVSVEGDRD